jgi:mRNA interferase RelE/StbE
MAYEVVAEKAVDRALDRFPDNIGAPIAVAMRALAENPRPHGCAQVKTRPGVWRVRVRSWRLLYTIDDESRLVTIVEIMPREADYKP